MADSEKLARAFIFERYLFIKNEDTGEFSCLEDSCPTSPILENCGNVKLSVIHNHTQFNAEGLEVEQHFDGLRVEMIRL